MSNVSVKFMSLIRPKRRWTQFSLGTMFVVMTALCLRLAWQTNRAHRQREAVAAIKAFGGKVQYEGQPSIGEWRVFGISLMSSFRLDETAGMLPEDSWLDKALGDFAHEVRGVLIADNIDADGEIKYRRVASADLNSLVPALIALPGLQEVYVDCDHIADEDLVILQRALPGCQILGTSTIRLR
jgi:hypothetical protein